MSESLVIWGAALALSSGVVGAYAWRFRGRVRHDAERKAEAAELGIDRPTAQYPFIDATRCVGCRACIDACPEGDPLGIVGGVAVVINGLRCVGHGHCEPACPVGAIQVGLGDMKSRADVPLLNDDQESSVPGVYIAGELGGLALVKNAVAQGQRAVEAIAADLAADGVTGGNAGDREDLVIVGAGPAGLAAALRASSLGLRYRVLEREEGLGGTILHYPRRKMVLTQPVALEPWGALDREEYAKETLLALFQSMVDDRSLTIDFASPVENVGGERGDFRIATSRGRTVRARRVLLVMGRRGTPRKLGVPGEELPKVMYRLIDAASYEDQRLLVVGGGDSAVEAAIGLSRQRGNRVTLSYRKEKLFRIKKKNADAVEERFARGTIEPVFSSNVMEIGRDSVRLSLGDGGEREIANDHVFIFAGGVPPFGFLRGIGVEFGGGKGLSPLYRALRAAIWIASLAAVAWLAADGLSYYLAPLVERPRHPAYWTLKPGGERGHLLGIVGSSLMVVMLVYSLRRRWKPLRRSGPLRVWLDFHIWCGVIGPLLVVLHSSFKVTGLVALSFWSMVVVALSGVLGRYLYVQIPRRRSGDALSLDEARKRSGELGSRLREAGVDEGELAALDRHVTGGLRPDSGLLSVLLRLPWQGLALRYRMWHWRRDLVRRAGALVPRATLRRLGQSATERALLERRIQLWDRLHGLFHWWHVLHKPFAVVMYVFMVVHIGVAVMTGYAFGG